jgi:hypothetical protein
MAILQPVRDKIHSIHLQEWLQGKNHHNLLTNECCPDFSCCNRHVNTSEEVKAKFIQNHSKNIPNDALLALFLARALESIGHEVTNKDIIEAINQ